MGPDPRPRCENGRCRSVSLDNVPAFVEARDVPVATPRWGTIPVDIAFGGVFYAQIDVDRLGLKITPDHARALAGAGMEIEAHLADQVAVRHPEIQSLTGIAYNGTKAAVARFTQNLARDHAPRKIRVNAVCLGEIHTPMLESAWRTPGARSPTSTGWSRSGGSASLRRSPRWWPFSPRTRRPSWAARSSGSPGHSQSPDARGGKEAAANAAFARPLPALA